MNLRSLIGVTVSVITFAACTAQTAFALESDADMLAQQTPIVSVSEVERVSPESTPAVSAVLARQFTLGSGSPSSLWKLRAHQGGAYRATVKWEEFKQFVCANSPEISVRAPACTDAQLSKLPKGIVVNIPAGEVLLIVPPGTKAPSMLALAPVDGQTQVLRVAPPSDPVVIAQESTRIAEVTALQTELASAKGQNTMMQIALVGTIVVAIMLQLFTISTSNTEAPESIGEKNEPPEEKPQFIATAADQTADIGRDNLERPTQAEGASNASGSPGDCAARMDPPKDPKNTIEQ